jgi:hypothetical protein
MRQAQTGFWPAPGGVASESHGLFTSHVSRSSPKETSSIHGTLFSSSERFPFNGSGGYFMDAGWINPRYDDATSCGQWMPVGWFKTLENFQETGAVSQGRLKRHGKSIVNHYSICAEMAVRNWANGVLQGADHFSAKMGVDSNFEQLCFGRGLPSCTCTTRGAGQPENPTPYTRMMSGG